jgi:hypothetical protein
VYVCVGVGVRNVLFLLCFSLLFGLASLVSSSLLHALKPPQAYMFSSTFFSYAFSSSLPRPPFSPTTTTSW